MAEENHKIITLTKLKSDEYRLWAIQARATFSVYEVLDIVEGTEVDPTPRNGPISPAMHTRIDKWKRKHALAKEALLKHSNPPNSLKSFPYKTVLQRFGTDVNKNTVKLLISNISEPTITGSMLFEKMTKRR
jgi:hypothetical protein